MAYTGPASGSGLAYGDYHGGGAEDTGPGRRRRKVGAFLRAANEVRQNYFNNDGSRDVGDESSTEGPGAFPDAAVVRSGNEEMILFPSYARKHVKSKVENMPGNSQSEQEFWRKEWEKHRNDTAVVDVDVRGWIYTPHRGSHTRKQRLVIGMARQISGIQAPPANMSTDTFMSAQPPGRAQSPGRASSRQEEDLISFEADKLLRRGQAEERNARVGRYTEDPNKDADTDSFYGGNSRESSPTRSSRLSQYSRASSDAGFSPPGSPTITPAQKRTSWSNPAKMSQSELALANTHLLTRLRPFMHNPLANTAITAFFYNEQASRQHTEYTDSSGHFSFHTALDFVPTHVRVLASEKLSATEEVIITPSKGVSLISDIDDTVKHSGISAGAREIFRNAFIRDLNDMTIDGVKEWYNTMHDMGVKMHYVSNSPWQMYPILSTYFRIAQLPRGSFHLKQYSGPLQGIFEPVAERKKSSLSKILRDFPDRKFILVGDSGEADLEVYTDVALDNPGRILGVFIRDVTMAPRTGYFDGSAPPLGNRRQSKHHSRNSSSDTLAMSKRLQRPADTKDDDAELQAAIAASLTDMEEEALRARRSINPDTFAGFDGFEGRMPRPALPPRRSTGLIDPNARLTASPQEDDLIDFSEEQPPPSRPWLEAPRRSISPQSANGIAKSQKPSPSPPPKPRALRSPSPNPPKGQQSADSAYKPPPPRPRKPSSAVKPSPLPQHLQTDGTNTPSPLPAQVIQPSPLSQVTQQSPTDYKSRPPLPTRPKTYQKLTHAVGSYVKGGQYGNGQQPRSPSYASSTFHLDLPRSMSAGPPRSFEDLRSDSLTPRGSAPPPPPPRRTMTPITALPYSTSSRRASNRLSGSGGWDDDGPAAGSPSEVGLSRKELLWQQRLAKARSVLEPRGVTLRTWKIGSDVADVCVRLAEMEIRRVEREGRKS